MPLTRPLLALVTISLPFLTACGGEEAQAAHSTDLTVTPLGLGIIPMAVPEGFTQAKAELGKILFFDPRLSSNDQMSCASCHQHDKGWSNGQAGSTKVDGAENTRNSPTLYNLGYHDLLYWDGRAKSLEENILAAWKGHMGGDPDAIGAELAAVDAYKDEFQEAFGKAPDAESMVSALSHFVRTLRSGDSPVDRFLAGDKTALSADASSGEYLFRIKAMCIRCHLPPLYTDMLFHNMGVGTGAENPDIGRGKYDKAKMGAFKTPTLRGVPRSGPYFHDGSVATLEEAVRLMVKGGIDNPNKDPLLEATNLSEQEIRQLIAFLRALDSTESFTPPKLY